MDTHVRTPQDIFLQPQHLVVPPFQRPYVWDKEEQWAPLWQDVRRLTESRLADRYSTPTHFLGAVVIQAQEPVAGALQAHNIIDGQQRLTTLQLLMDAAAAVLDASGSQALAAQLDVLTHNQAIYVTEGVRLKIRHTNRDQAAFDEVMQADPPVVHPELRHAGSLIARAHEYFASAVQEWLGDAAEPEFVLRASTLVDVLTRGLQLVAINLGVNENSQEIFETLNARGTPLTAADLIKNFVFQKLAAEGADTKKVYAEQWSFDTKFWEGEVSVGRYAISRSSLFFNQWLASRVGEEISPKSTFTRFKHYVERESGRKVTDLLPILKEQAALYEAWTRAAEDPDKQLTRVELSIYRMKSSEVELLKPLLIWLHEPGRAIPPHVIDDVVSSAESWLVRRQLLRLTTSDLGRIVADVIRVHRDAPASELADRVRAHLTRLNVSSTYWPGDEEIRVALRTEQTYRRFKRGRLRMLLEAVEDHHRATTNQPRVPRRGYPIEHILPQKWSDNWAVESLEAEQERGNHVHRLGNLTLLTSSLNSKVSNGAWPTKRAALAQHDTLLMNSRLLAEVGGDDWDEDQIDLRTESVVDILLQVWPVPAGHEGDIVDPQAKTQEGVEIKDLVRAGLLQPGTVLTPRPSEHELHTAVVVPDGTLEVKGRRFETPSGAGKEVLGRAVNGWFFWRLDDGRKLSDVRAEFRGDTTTQEGRFDWTALHAILEALPAGSWTTYGSLADAVGTAAQPLGGHITKCLQCTNAHRILAKHGRVAPAFTWSDPNDQRDPKDLLLGEGLAFIEDRADPTRELANDDLVALISE
ncbi:DUF262 domain-containing protein [Aeromicrobium sp. Leaf245]|uniref:GmrSD restriction endonuclease domain-containing protein n=1 Tax=Aeromicrobium sp. Leaf245 TaxID=1736306 RepID=UPI0009E7BFA2|nr:DUF262 domain-containing protein [Aeromicrobium sp. Leaf245]